MSTGSQPVGKRIGFCLPPFSRRFSNKVAGRFLLLIFFSSLAVALRRPVDSLGGLYSFIFWWWLLNFSSFFFSPPSPPLSSFFIPRFSSSFVFRVAVRFSLLAGHPSTHTERKNSRERLKKRERERTLRRLFSPLSLSLSLYFRPIFSLSMGDFLEREDEEGGAFGPKRKRVEREKFVFFHCFYFFFFFASTRVRRTGEKTSHAEEISRTTHAHTHKTLENDEPFRRRVPPPPPRKIPPEQKENVAERKHKNGRRPGTRSRNGPATRTRPNPTVFRDRESQPDRRRNNRPERLEQSGVAANGGAPLAGRRRRHLTPSSDRTDNYVTTSFLFSSPFRPLSNNVSPDPNRNERVSIQTSGWKRSFFVFVSCFLFFSSQRNVAIRYDARTADDGGRCRHV